MRALAMGTATATNTGCGMGRHALRPTYTSFGKASTDNTGLNESAAITIVATLTKSLDRDALETEEV